MARSKVLLLGASGETGRSVLDGLLEHGQNEVVALIRPASAKKPIVATLKARGVEVRVGDASDDVESLVSLLKDIDVVISTISAGSQLEQLSLITAAKKAGVKRFVPCGFITVAPPGGVMELRDQKEVVYQHMRKLYLPFTIIDVGFWYQLSFPAVPSGKVNYAMVQPNDTTMVDEGAVKTGITDVKDVGRYVALIVNDPRTLNQMIYTFAEVLNQKEMFKLMEETSSEKIEPKILTGAEIEASLAEMKRKRTAEPENAMYQMMIYAFEYLYSKFVRGDNTPESAKYLGYLSATELYPTFTPLKFRDYLQHVHEGKAYKPYPQLSV